MIKRIGGKLDTKVFVREFGGGKKEGF